ncbi:hypothetical protein [Sphingosinicella sp.]|uniref:hypothetical protein n=1 Tax=Sphingosinicella sp. TaxID=1917971 RepID=UPI004037A94C
MVRAIAAALLLAAPAAAQPPSPSAQTQATDSLAWLVGRWEGIGTMFLENSLARLEVRPVLGGRFLELSYRAGGFLGDRFEGRAFYRSVGDGRWQATWFDSRGASFPIAATLSARTLTAEWGSAETERGRTVYSLAAGGRLEIVDSVRQPDGSYREFANHSLSRAD